MRSYCGWLVVALALATVLGCSGNDYDRVVKKELARGVRYDSLFFGIYLGMSAEDFYAHCWEMNKKGLWRQGPRNLTVQYEMEKELKAPAYMDFYPIFEDGKIVEMPVTFSYKAWAPWNRELFNDSLLVDVLRLFEEWYGEGFRKVEGPNGRIAYVKVDGNRRISLYKDPVNDIEVEAWFVDLLAKKEEEKTQ